jgi:flagellar motility protein MotE (MotC chaperone)
MRLALIEAAEKRIAERTAALEALEAQINSLLGARDEAEKAQFQAVVSMYETMKPRDAAAILGALDMPVLLRVARAMSPRKMAPILAQMDPARARDLTASMAAPEAPKMVQVATDPISQLPQIVGQ